jgi:hypothetical protein
VVIIATINAIEDNNVPSSLRKGELEAIQAALDVGGIEFTNGDEPGVKLKAKPKGKAKKMPSGNHLRKSSNLKKCQ